MILVAYGTRPEYIKIKPLINEMAKRNISFKTLFTGQHQNLVNKNADFVLATMPSGSNRLDDIIKICMNTPESYFQGINYLLIQGDTTTAMGLALCGLHRKIKIIHLEAGLRSFDNDNPYPEENNRKIISTLADIHLCPTMENRKNLIKENVSKNKIFVVGNTVLDNLVSYKEKTSYQNKVLITLHRRENHDILQDWFMEISKLGEKYSDLDFIFPLHPNPNVQKHKKLLKNINVIDPMDYEKLLELLITVKIVITDSGGLQEECSFLNKKCLICRKTTERPEFLNLGNFLVKTPKNLGKIFKKHIENCVLNIEKCPYGDGCSSRKICDLFETLNI